MFNLFKCRHKRTYEVTTKMNDGSLVVNHYCRKCEEFIRGDTERLKECPHFRVNDECICGLPSPSNRVETTSDNDDKETYKGEDIAKLRHQGMLLEKVPEKYITVEVDEKYLRAWAGK